MSKVLVIFPAMGAGTDPLYWGPLFSSLAARGEAVRILVGHALEASRLPGCDVAPEMRMLRLGRLRIPNVARLASEIGKHCDVCVVNEFSPQSVLAILICRLLRRPSVLLVENHARFLAGYGVDRSGFYVALRKFVVRMSTVVLTNNRWGHEYVTNDLGAPESKVRVGPYLTSVLPGPSPAVGNASPTARAVRSPDVPLRLVAVGQLIARKGFDILVDELARLPLEVREGFEVSVFGNGPERAALQAKIDGLGLRQQVRLKGQVPYAELSRHLAAFDGFVVSTLADYRSLSAFEAIAQGFPLLMSIHDGAISEVLQEGSNGFSFDPKKEGQLAAAMLELRKALDAGVPMRRASLQRAEGFTVPKAVDILQSAVQAALRSRGATYGSKGA